MKKPQKIISPLMAITLLASCAQPGGPGYMQGGGGFNKQDVGTVAGAIGGGVIGSTMGGGHGKIATTIAGTLLGGLIGSEIGKSLDNADRAAMDRTTQRALETGSSGQSLPWQATNSGAVIPGNYYQRDGQYCREYTQRINVGGRTQEGYGTACRQPDGSWKVVQ